MKSTIITVAFFLTVCPAFAQQSGTTTECEKSVGGDRMTCKTTQNPPTLAEILRPKHTNQPQTVVAAAPSGLSPEAVKVFLAEEKATRDAKDTVDFIYCRQNPKGNVTDGEKQRACADVIEYTKAFCLVNPEVERCTLAKSKAEVEKAFAALTDDYNTNPRRTKKDVQGFYDSLFARYTKWGCMSFPDLTLPQRDGTLHLCPNAPEHAPVHSDTGSQMK
jgi:hypothetical protein